MEVVLFIFAIISGSAILTFGVVKTIPKIKTLNFPKINFPRVKLPKVNLLSTYKATRWMPKYLKKKEEQPRNVEDFDLEIVTINGEQVPRLVPKKPEGEKSSTSFPLNKNTLVMAGVVVVAAAVGYYIIKNRKK